MFACKLNVAVPTFLSRHAIQAKRIEAAPEIYCKKNSVKKQILSQAKTFGLVQEGPTYWQYVDSFICA